MQKTFSFIFISCFFILSSFAQDYSDKVKIFDAYVKKAKAKWEIPGLSIAVVKDGAVLLNKGYGVRKTGSNQMVDKNTLFGIASTTKAMTAAAMGILVDRGLLNWEDKVIDYLPTFQLKDPYVTREIKIKDLFTHNAGLGNADFLWANNDLGADEILFRMRYAEPSYSFRGGYTYQNIMYLVAGEIIERVSGKSWGKFLNDNLWIPIGMTNTYPFLEDASKKSNVSIPHHYVDGKITPIKETSADVIGPAGSVWSCVEDMSKWMNFLLDQGKVNGARVLSLETFNELFKPQIIIPKNQFYPSVQLTHPTWTTYGLGWFQHDYYGQTVHFHTGSLGGRIAIIGLLPSENLGFYFLGNLDHAELRHALMYKAFDLFGSFDSKRDWSSEMFELYKTINENSETRKQKFNANRVQNTKPSKPLSNYLGTYNDPFYGEATVAFLDNKLILKLSSKILVELKHWHYDAFLGDYINHPWWSPSLVQFQLNRNGDISGLEIDGKKYKKL